MDELKVETEMDACCVCGGIGAEGELLTPEEHDAVSGPLQVPLRTMLLQLNNNKVIPEGRICMLCARKASDAYEFSSNLSSRTAPPLSEKIRALRRRLHELTQKIDVFIVVGGAGGTESSYSEDDIIMVEKDALAAAAAADDEDLERARNARGDTVYQCSVCPVSFQRVSEYRAHMAAHPLDALHSCWTCGAQFTSRDALRDHARAHAGAQLVCNLCHHTAQTQAEMRRHEAECPSRCPACGLVAADRGALATHAAAAHARGTPPPHVCPSCFLTFDAEENLVAHAMKHRQAKQFVCGYDGCILRFGTRSNLMNHIRKCHVSEATDEAGGAGAGGALGAPSLQPQQETNVVTCDECGRTFGSLAAMRRHARVHRKHVEIVQEVVENMDAEDGDVEYLEVETLEDLELDLKQELINTLTE